MLFAIAVTFNVAFWKQMQMHCKSARHSACVRMYVRVIPNFHFSAAWAHGNRRIRSSVKYGGGDRCVRVNQYACVLNGAGVFAVVHSLDERREKDVLGEGPPADHSQQVVRLDEFSWTGEP